MNPRRIPTLALLALVATLAVACASFNQTVVSITSVVDVAMKNWAEMSVKGLTTPAIDAKVVAAHDQYRAACTVARKALEAYKASGDVGEYQQALSAVKVAASGLIDLILPLLAPPAATQIQTSLQKANAL